MQEQAKWVKETVGNSRARWKIIVSGLPTACHATSGSSEDASGLVIACRNRNRASSALKSIDNTDSDGGNVRSSCA